MGGSPEWKGDLVPLCRPDHESLTRNEWTLRVEDGIAVGLDLKGEVLFVRPYEPLEVALSFSSYPREILKKRGLLTFLTDENLCYFIGRALVAAKTNVLNIGMAADVFRERYGHFGGQWYVRAAEIIRDNNQDGQRMSYRELRRCHAIYLQFKDQPQLLELFPKSLAAACAEAEEPEKAIEMCHVALLEEGRTPTVREVRERFGHKSTPEDESKWETCPRCNGLGRVKKEPEPGE